MKLTHIHSEEGIQPDLVWMNDKITTPQQKRLRRIKHHKIGVIPMVYLHPGVYVITYDLILRAAPQSP